AVRSDRRPTPIPYTTLFRSDRVGDDLPADQAVAHAEMAHHDAVGRGRGAEDLWHSPAGANALDALAGEAVKMGVAGGDVAVQVGDRKSTRLNSVTIRSRMPS